MSTLKVRNIESPDGGVADNLKTITAFAWVNFNGVTNTINDSHNVLGVTDNGTGDYDINFDNAANDANYSAFADNSAASSTGSSNTLSGHTTTSVRVRTYGISGGAEDPNIVSVLVVGGQS